jgi:DNA-binding MarR family transcriptional regulator
MAARLEKGPRQRGTAAADSRAKRDTITPRENAFRCIRALIAVLQTSARAVESRSGLTNAQLFLLRQIAATDGLTINDLADRTSAAQSSVSVVVGRRVKSGRVRRGRGPARGSRLGYPRTARGRTTLLRAPAPTTERLLDALGRLEPGEVRSISRGLKALLAMLDESTEQRPLLFEG